MLHVDSSLISNEKQTVEWVVLPPSNNNEAIPLEATLRTIIPFNLILVDNFTKKCFLGSFIAMYKEKKNPKSNNTPLAICL